MKNKKHPQYPLVFFSAHLKCNRFQLKNTQSNFKATKNVRNLHGHWNYVDAHRTNWTLVWCTQTVGTNVRPTIGKSKMMQ